MSLKNYALSNHVDIPEDKPLADLNSQELTAYLVKYYPSGAKERLSELYRNGMIGSFLYQQVNIILEGADYAEG